MCPVTVLLIQIRRASDEMAAHELSCIRRRLGSRLAELRTRNVLHESVEPSELKNVDAVIFGGSGDFSVHDPRSAKWVTCLRQLLDIVLSRNLPGFGICFGHQLLGYHLGQQVSTSNAHAELGTIRLTLTPEGQRDPLFSQLDGEFMAQTGHSDHVLATPVGVSLLAESEQLATQAFKVNGSRFYSTQFHPDMTGAEAACRYLAYRESLSRAKGDDAKKGAAGVPETGNLFRAGTDAATLLLGGFVDQI